jgi:hypothetical protein
MFDLRIMTSFQDVPKGRTESGASVTRRALPGTRRATPARAGNIRSAE